MSLIVKIMSIIFVLKVLKVSKSDQNGQNNRSWRYSYNTDTGYEGGASMQPTGVPGRSSGHSYWRD